MGVFVVGDKGRSQLRRVYPDKLLGFTQDNGKFGGLTFGVASLISEEILKAEADKVMIAYNRFFNAAKYVPTIATCSHRPLRRRWLRRVACSTRTSSRVLIARRCCWTWPSSSLRL